MAVLEKIMQHPEFTVFIWLSLVTIVPIIGGFWYAFRVKQWEMALKQAMIERGMSAEEIKMVLQATSKATPHKATCWQGTPESQDALTPS
jgi:hypothetical protein